MLAEVKTPGDQVSAQTWLGCRNVFSGLLYGSILSKHAAILQCYEQQQSTKATHVQTDTSMIESSSLLPEKLDERP
jgi:hypothetical protein